MQLVSGQNCSPELAAREFRATRRLHRKNSPVWFYHYVQSFHPDEPVTPEEAHRLAKEFSARAWPDSEVLIATHSDAPHIHTHFIVNAVCLSTGKMLRQGPNTLKTLRSLSDALCRAHSLSVLPVESKKESRGMSAREYRSAVKGNSIKLRLASAVDRCMRKAGSREEFIRLMAKYGWQVRWEEARKHITYIYKSGWKCRDDKLHEEKYLKERMVREFEYRKAAVYGGAEIAERSPGVRRGAPGTAGSLPSHGGVV